MTDTKRKRLVQGYDLTIKSFRFEMYDPAGLKTVYLDDAGQFRLTGKPLLEMYDNQAVPVKRLKEGYDLATSNFVFELYNKLGSKTIGIDSSGNGTLNAVTLRNDLIGSSYIQMDGNGLRAFDGYRNTIEITSNGLAYLREVILRNGLIGDAFVEIDGYGFRASDGYKNTVEIDSSGRGYFRGDITSDAYITGATIRSGPVGTDRLELSGGKFRGVTSSELITGMCFDIGTVPGTGLADIGFYHNGSKLLEFYDEITNMWIRPGAGAYSMRLGKSGYNTNFEGVVKFNNASVEGLLADTAGVHNHGINNGMKLALTDGSGTVTGYIAFEESGAHTHNVG
jgi:hypothetical protein